MRRILYLIKALPYFLNKKLYLNGAQHHVYAVKLKGTDKTYGRDTYPVNTSYEENYTFSLSLTSFLLIFILLTGIAFTFPP